jgi:hypothetical protein
MVDAARREKLLQLAEAVRSFFEVTNVTESRGWSAAFKAVRVNDYMADSFLAELRALIDFIEVEFERAPVKPSRFMEPSTAQMWSSDRPPRIDPEPVTARVTASRTPVVTRSVRQDSRERKTVPPPSRDKETVPPPMRARSEGPPARPVRSPPPAPRPRSVPPPPPPPRRNQYAEVETRAAPPPQFERTEPNQLPPEPKKRR